MNLRAKITLLFLGFALVSCQRPDEVIIPSDTLSQDEMVTILTDIHLVEGAKVGNKIMGDTIAAPVYFNKVYKKHGITEAKFEEDFRFYSEHPKLMIKVYERVIENLNKIEIAPPKDAEIDEIAREQTSIAAPISNLEKLQTKKSKDQDSSQAE